MSTVISHASITPEQLLQMPDADRYELVEGELVERKMGWKSGWIAGRLQALLVRVGDADQCGWLVSSDAGYQCFPDAPSKVRKPDLSFIKARRLPPDRAPDGHCRVAPDLAVEVISPNDLYSEVEVKVDEYLRANVQLVWVVDPATRSVRVHRSDGTVTDLNEGDELAGESVLPGFRCRVAELFQPPEGS